MNRTELFKILKERNQNLHDSYYEIKKISNSDTIQFIKEDDSIRRRTSIRVYMYGKMLFAGGYSLIIKPLEQKFEPLVIPELKGIYGDAFSMSFNKFYQTDYCFDITIETDDDWKTFLDEFDKCLKFYEAEIFPKLTDIKFLAEYVGSVPFSNQLEIVVGSSYPVNVFKKLAILKWGGQLERYEEYKAGLLERFEANLTNPTKAQMVPTYKNGYNKLINHLENEPNPFGKKKIS